jgi:hypothetical protein
MSHWVTCGAWLSAVRRARVSGQLSMSVFTAADGITPASGALGVFIMHRIASDLSPWTVGYQGASKT